MAQIRLIGTDPSQVPTNGMLGNLAFQNAESVSLEKLVVTEDVGIGTSSPNDVLDIAAGNYGGITIKCGTTVHRPTLSFFNTTDSLAAYIQATGNSLAFGSMNIDYGGHTPRMTLTSTGLGIGSTGPLAKLDVISSTLPQVYFSSSETDGNTKYLSIASRQRNSAAEPEGVSVIAAECSAGDNVIHIGGYLGELNAATVIRLYTANNLTTRSGTERLRITSTGTVNIVGAGTAGSTQAVSFSGSAPVNSLVLDSSGRVGLGTSSLSALLHCFSPDSINTTAYFRLTNSSVGSGLYRNLHIDGTHPNGASFWKGIDITPTQATTAPMTGIDMSWNQIYSEGRGVNINLSKNTHAGGGAGIGVFSRVIATGTNDLSYEAIGGWFVTDKGAGALDPYTSYTLKVENRSTVNNTNLTAFYTDSSTIRGSIYYDRTNNALALSGSNAFRIDTNGSPRLFVNSSGNVGIGNVSPTYKLTIDKQGTADWGAGLKRILSVDNNWVYSTFRTPYTVTTTTHPAGWYNIVKILSWDFNVGIHISFSGDFTADQIDIEAKSSWNPGLNNSNAGPHLRVNRTMAHNGNRLQQVRIGYDSIGNTYIQAYLNLTFGAAGAVKVAVVDKCSAWADTVVKAEPMLTTATSITVLNTVNLANTAGEYYNLNGVAGDFVWGTNATERLRITSTGTVNIVGAGTAGSTQAVSFSGTAPVNSLVLDSSGRVGLGTSGPVSGNVATLNIRQTGGNLSTTTVTRANVQGIIAADGASTSNNVGNGIWFDSGSLIAGIASTRANTGNWGTDLRFYTHPTTTTNQDETYERLRIDPAGNVGINNPSPDYKLDVKDGTIRVRMGALAGAELGGHPSEETGFVKWAADNHHGIWFRGSVNSGGGTVTGGDVTTFREYGEFQFWTGGSNMSLRMKITSAGHMLPGLDNSYDLGSTSLRWRNLYTTDLHLSNEGKPGGNQIDGTTGNWTIQEGEESLYIINNKSLKKYRFILEEIE